VCAQESDQERKKERVRKGAKVKTRERSRQHCNTLQHTATRCNALQHTATRSTHYNTQQHITTHGNTLQHSATLCNTLLHSTTLCNTLQHCTARQTNTQHIRITHKVVCKERYVNGTQNLFFSSTHFGTQNRRTGWHRVIECLKLQVIDRKRATNYKALLRRMTYKDKASYYSTPPCIKYTFTKWVCQTHIGMVYQRHIN